MELKIDSLGKKKRNTFRVVLRILFFLLASVWIIPIIGKEFLKSFSWLYYGIFAAIGASIGTIGNTLDKSCIFSINFEVISLKTGIFNKEQFINWSEIKSISCKLYEFKIKKTDDTTMIIDLSKFDYALLQEIKKVVDCIAKEKYIQSNL